MVCFRLGRTYQFCNEAAEQPLFDLRKASAKVSRPNRDSLSTLGLSFIP